VTLAQIPSDWIDRMGEAIGAAGVAGTAFAGTERLYPSFR
jgi:hypothetical protein